MLGRNARRPFAGLAALLPLGCAPAAVGVVLATSDGGSSSRGGAGGSAVTAPVVSYSFRGGWLEGPGPRVGGQEIVGYIYPGIQDGHDIRIGGQPVEWITRQDPNTANAWFRVRGPLPYGEAPVSVGPPGSMTTLDRPYQTQLFRRGLKTPAVVSAVRLAALDFDGDGDEDLVLLKSDDAPPVLLRNDRQSWTVSGEVQHGPRYHLPYVTADMDGDGRKDLVGARDADVLVHRNRGDGTIAFVSSCSLVVRGAWGGNFSPYVSGLANMDVDGDGDLDVVATSSEGLHVLSNAAGVLQQTGFIARTQLGGLRFVGDLDGDGDLDLLTTSFDRPGVVIRNDGHGAFNPLPTLPSGEILALIDLDGDGDLDMLCVRGQVFENLGGLQFVDRGVEHARLRVNYGPVLLGDLTRDGRPDAVTLQDLQAWIFPGPGQPLTFAGAHTTIRAFTDPPRSQSTYSQISPQHIALLDVDADGDLDLAVLTLDGVWILVND